jgi:hypothetical protein
MPDGRGKDTIKYMRRVPRKQCLFAGVCGLSSSRLSFLLPPQVWLARRTSSWRMNMAIGISRSVFTSDTGTSRPLWPTRTVICRCQQGFRLYSESSLRLPCLKPSNPDPFVRGTLAFPSFFIRWRLSFNPKLHPRLCASSACASVQRYCPKYVDFPFFPFRPFAFLLHH